jgi:N-acetylneuraminic acid mutarotase
MAAAEEHGLLFVFSGCGSEGRLNDLWQFNLSTKEWIQLPSNDAIRGRGGSSLFYAKDRLFVIAGFAGEETNDCYSFNLKSRTWR